MSETQQQPLTVERFNEFRPIVDGVEKYVPLDFVVNNEALLNPTAKQVHVYAGIREENRAAIHAMEVLDKLKIPASAIILPFHYLPANDANIKRVIVEGPREFARHQNIRSGKSEDSPVDLLGSSQGGGAVIMAADETPELFDAIAARAPVGLNQEAFGDVDKRRGGLRELKFMYRLAVENAFKGDQMPLHFKSPHVDIGNILGQYEVMKGLIDDAGAHRLGPKLNFALSRSLANQVSNLRKENHPINIFVGEDDPIFRLSEIIATLGEVGCDDLITTMEGASHSAIMSNAGTRQLEIAANWLKSTRGTIDTSR
jgi:hypothetical protein